MAGLAMLLGGCNDTPIPSEPPEEPAPTEKEERERPEPPRSGSHSSEPREAEEKTTSDRPPTEVGSKEDEPSSGADSKPETSRRREDRKTRTRAKTRTASEALTEAERLAGEAKSLVEQGRRGDAYRRLAEAYEAVRPHADDPGCKAFTKDLLGEIKTLGKAIDAKVREDLGADVSGQTLIDIDPDQ